MKRKEAPSLERVRQVFRVNKLTGEVFYKIAIGKKHKGDLAGCQRPDGYWYLALDGNRYLAHYLIWYHETGDWEDEIDHQDRIRNHNWLTNLRPATRSQNNGNTLGWTSKKKSGLPRGVYLHPGDKTRFRAQIYIRYKAVHLGCFDTIAEAQEAYRQAAQQHFGEFAA